MFWLLLIVYTISFGLILFNQGLFWDDWLYFNQPAESLMQVFTMSGLPWFGWLHLVLMSLKSAWIYRLITFVSYFTTGLLINNILKNIRKIEPYTRVWLVLFYLVFPVNSARIAIINLPYTVCLLLFFTGFWLVSLIIKKQHLLLRLLALTCFLISFTTASLLVYYLLVLIYLVYQRREQFKSLKSAMRLALSYLDFLLLPIIFWIIKNNYFAPYGFYQQYNQLSTASLAWAFIKLPIGFYTSFVAVFLKTMQILLKAENWWLFILLVIGLMKLIKKFPLRPKISTKQPKNYLHGLVFGLGCLSLGLFPYFAVNLLPTLDDWNSRHQLLVPLGASFLIVFGVKLILIATRQRQQLAIYILTLLLTLFSLKNINYYLDFQRDWYKQLALIRQLAKDTAVKTSNTILVDDQTISLNANNRTYRYYEYSSMLEYVYGDQSRLMLDQNQFYDASRLPHNYIQFYKLKDYQLTDPELKVTIGQGELNLTTINLVKLKWLEYSNPSDFNNYLDQVVKVNSNFLN